MEQHTGGRNYLKAGVAQQVHKHRRHRLRALKQLRQGSPGHDSVCQRQPGRGRGTVDIDQACGTSSQDLMQLGGRVDQVRWRSILPVALEKALEIGTMGDCLRRWLAITGLDQHDFAGEIARMQWIFRETVGVVGVQFNRPAVVNQQVALGADGVPGEGSEAFVVRQEMQTQGMTGRLCHGESEGGANDLTTGSAVTAEQQVEELVAVYLTEITEKPGRRRVRMGKPRERGGAGQRKAAMPMATAILERDRQLEAFAGAAWGIRRHW